MCSVITMYLFLTQYSGYDHGEAALSLFLQGLLTKAFLLYRQKGHRTRFMVKAKIWLWSLENFTLIA